MPQGRRKVPFSGKAKKQQMQAKKQRQTNNFLLNSSNSLEYEEKSYVKFENNDKNAVRRKNKKIDEFEKPCGSRSYIDINNGRQRNNKVDEFEKTYNQNLPKSSKNEEENFATINMIPLKEQELEPISHYFPHDIDMPKRPLWTYDMTKSELESREQQYFLNYQKSLRSDVSYYEQNLEYWRQLWRVQEMADILLIIVDIRFAPLMFPPYLYKYIKEELGKEMILILNKIDLVPSLLASAWRDYFIKLYPELHILMFTSYPNNSFEKNNKDKNLKRLCKRQRRELASTQASLLIKECESIVQGKVNLSSWNKKVQEEKNSKLNIDEDLSKRKDIVIEKRNFDFHYVKHEQYKNNVLTLGCIGTPNVGKSSLINSLIGDKVVSVSRTPGHTKHFQTIFLTNNVCLCDCPGLVFPSLIPRPLQILMGLYPIAQVRNPYKSIKFIGERINLPEILRIRHQCNSNTWSAMDICEGWAAKKDFHTARAARLDTYRAANSILRLSLEGKIPIHIYPENWTVIKDYYGTQNLFNNAMRNMRKGLLREPTDSKKTYPAISDDEGLANESEEEDFVSRSDEMGEEDNSEEESGDSSELSSDNTIDCTNNKFQYLSIDL